MKNFNELCCHKGRDSYGNEVDMLNDDINLNYLTVMQIASIFSVIAQYCVKDYKTDGYYDVARASWEYENNGVVRIFARENGIDCEWRYDFYEKEGCKSALECAKKHLGCDVEIVLTKNEDKSMSADVYVRSKAEYLREYKFDNIDSPTSSFIYALKYYVMKVTHHQLEE